MPHGIAWALSSLTTSPLRSGNAKREWIGISRKVHVLHYRTTEDHDLHLYVEQKVLFRSDTLLPLSVVSKRYRVVQPLEVVEFYRDLTAMFGYQLETSNVLKEVRKFWALARTGPSTTLKGNYVVDSCTLLATSCDGTLANTATPTTVRVVCNHTLSIALNGASQAVKVPHSTRFDVVVVKRQLGLAVSNRETFMYGMKTLADRKIRPTEATDYITRAITDTTALSAMPAKLASLSALKRVIELYEGRGMSSELRAAQGTARELLNAVTQYVDDERRARDLAFRTDLRGLDRTRL